MTRRLLFVLILLVAAASAQVTVSGGVTISGGVLIGAPVGASQPFFGGLYTPGENGTLLIPSDYATPTAPTYGNGALDGAHPTNAYFDEFWNTPIWKVCGSETSGGTTYGAVSAAATYAWSVPVDDLHRWAFCTTLSGIGTGYQSKKVVNLYTNSLVCNLGSANVFGGPGHANVIREPFTGTGYVVNSAVTIVSGSFPLDKSLTATDIVINGVTYQVASDNGSITLSQSGINVGSAGSPVSISAGWNDQDLVYGVVSTASQIVRINVRVCQAADTSQTTAPGQPSWELWDTINDGSSKWGTGKLFDRLEMCGNVYSDMSDDGGSFAIGDNTNGTGNTYDCRRYTLGSKNAGTVSAPLARFHWYSITSLNCPSGGSTCSLTTSGGPDYRVGDPVQVLSPNMCCASAGAGGLKHNAANTCRIGSATSANAFGLVNCPTFTSTVNDTSGYTNIEGRSASILPPLPNVPTVGAGGDHFMQYNVAGNSATCQTWGISTIMRDGSGVGTVILVSAPYPAWILGHQFTVAGTTNFNGTYLITAVNSTTSFNFAKTGTAVSESAGGSDPFFGTVAVCGENKLYMMDSSTGTEVRQIVADAGHIAGYVDPSGDWHVIQYAGHYVNSATQGYITMTNPTCGGIFDWNFRTDALSCVIGNEFDHNNSEFYSTFEATRRGLGSPYVLISQSDNSMRAMPYTQHTYATRPASGTYVLTDALNPGDCRAGGGTQRAVCAWTVAATPNGSLADWLPLSYASVPLAAGTIHVGSTDYAYDYVAQLTKRFDTLSTGQNSAFVPTAFRGEILLYDTANKKVYHLLHHFTRQINAFYNNGPEYNSNVHLFTSRDGQIVCFDSSWGPGTSIGAYCAQVLK